MHAAASRRATAADGIRVWKMPENRRKTWREVLAKKGAVARVYEMGVVIRVIHHMTVIVVTIVIAVITFLVLLLLLLWVLVTFSDFVAINFFVTVILVIGVIVLMLLLITAVDFAFGALNPKP